jgi:hypothetical protein
MPSARDPFFGRTELEWEELEATGWELLADRTAQLTTYTDLNKALARITGQPPWDFSNPADRNAIAYLLGGLSDRSYSECLAAGKNQSRPARVRRSTCGSRVPPTARPQQQETSHLPARPSCSQVPRTAVPRGSRQAAGCRSARRRPPGRRQKPPAAPAHKPAEPGTPPATGPPATTRWPSPVRSSPAC